MNLDLDNINFDSEPSDKGSIKSRSTKRRSLSKKGSSKKMSIVSKKKSVPKKKSVSSKKASIASKSLSKSSSDKKSAKKNDIYVIENMPDAWKSKLLSDNFVIKKSLNKTIEDALIGAGIKTDKQKLEKSISKYITNLNNNDFFNLIEHYKKNGYDINVKSKRDFTTKYKNGDIQINGPEFLNLISHALEIDFILFNSENYDIHYKHKPYQKIIILYCDSNTTLFDTICLKLTSKVNSKIISMFNRKDLPSELDTLLDQHTFLLNHIKSVCEKNSCLKLNKIIQNLEQKLNKEFSTQEKQTVLHLINQFLVNKNYFAELNHTNSRKNTN